MSNGLAGCFTVSRHVRHFCSLGLVLLLGFALGACFVCVCCSCFASGEL